MLRIALLLCAFLAWPLKAATVINLYQAEVVLPDTDRASETKAREAALAQVLVKVSGQSTITENEVIQKAMANSRAYVSQFGYGSQDGQQTLALAFDRGQVRNLLTQANATLWREERPSVLVWLVKDANRNRDIVWDQSGSALTAQLKRAADQRGVPVMVPIGDFEDVTAINIPDLWGGFVQPIAGASARYQPDAILVIRMRQSAADNVDLGWQLFADTPEQLANSQTMPAEGRAAGSTADALKQMMDQVADTLAAKYAVPLGGAASDAFAIEVANIRSTEDFFALERLLTNLTSVASVNASRLQGNSVIFAVNLLSTENAFYQELGRDTRLSRASVALPGSESGSSEVMTPEEKLQVLYAGVESDTAADSDAVDVSATLAQPRIERNQFYWRP
ncbi:DUF2066 domain-containing protein [Photobacterium sp. MCCC 1A19761]|uniref:DUF2066 domain-containing protein n=1 Tax=Photobacterium sp. MCCC 1A19761 TaxID=3115000 RepID=UPI00307D8658